MVKLSAKTITRWQKLPEAGNDMMIEEVSIEMMLHLFNQAQGYNAFFMLNSMSMKVSIIVQLLIKLKMLKSTNFS